MRLDMVIIVCLWNLMVAPLQVDGTITVNFEKLSTLFLPYTYSPTIEYALDKDAAEQTAFDPKSNLLYSVGHTNLHVIDISSPNNMEIVFNVTYPDVDVTDVEVCGDYLFVAMDNLTTREHGFVNVYRTYNTDMNVLEMVHHVIVGAIPDMIQSTSDCSRVIIAIEAEPYDTPEGLVDPSGGIGIIKFTGTPAGSYKHSVHGFEAFNSRFSELEKTGTRFIYRGNNNTFSNDIEPEYIAFNHDETKAFITLQENNAIAVFSMVDEQIENIFGLGYKDWKMSSFDPDDRDGINMNAWPVFGMYQPDAISVYTHSDVDYVITANEGDSKDYEGFSEETRVADEMLSEMFEPNSTKREEMLAAIGRLKITTVNGRNATTGKFDSLYSFGGRGFSIWKADTMEQVYDSGRDVEWRISSLKPHLFNSDPGTEEPIKQTMDQRSDDKGAETESLITVQFGHYTLVIIGNERPGVISVYAIDNDRNEITPEFVTLFSDIPDVNETWNSLYEKRGLSAVDPEDLRFIPASQSPNEHPLLVVSGSYSGSITIYKINLQDSEDDQNANGCRRIVFSIGSIPVIPPTLKPAHIIRGFTGATPYGVRTDDVVPTESYCLRKDNEHTSVTCMI